MRIKKSNTTLSKQAEMFAEVLKSSDTEEIGKWKTLCPEYVKEYYDSVIAETKTSLLSS